MVMEDSGKQALVEVLLATYNGERFLREQIDSILAQDYPNLRVLARDDGSSDQTADTLNEYAARFPGRFQVLQPSPATGSAAANFLLLMKASTAPYICFSDQDDVWLPDKVSRTKQAMDQLESQWGADAPLLVFTDLLVVDDQLKTLHDSFWAHQKIEPARIHRLPPLLVQNVVTGCTAMLNRKLLERSLSMPGDALMHDHWIALLASSMGKSAAVSTPTILYRQHDRNLLGAGNRAQTLADLNRRIRRSREREMQWEKSQRQAEAFLRVHGDELSSQNRDHLKAYLPRGTKRSRLRRISNMLRHGFHRVGFVSNLMMIVDLWTMNPR
jgi:glycosyltransferase involved in cell wall biosynthesis